MAVDRTAVHSALVVDLGFGTRKAGSEAKGRATRDRVRVGVSWVVGPVAGHQSKPPSIRAGGGIISVQFQPVSPIPECFEHTSPADISLNFSPAQ